MQTSSGAPRLRFGRFELDQVAGELYCDGTRVRLQEQPRQVLVALLERPGEIVTREDLRERLWKSDTFVDFEHGLNTAVKKVRQALGDSADAPEFIETLARRGYRFIGRVDRPAIADTVAPTLPAEAIAPGELPRPVRRVSRTPFGVAIALVIAGAVLGTGLAWRHDRQSSLAVMPLRVLTDSANESAYLGVGIADAITTGLANTRQIAVRPTSAVLPFKDAQSDPAHVARSLGVQHLLLGTIQPTEQSYRITLQLVGRDGVLVWGHTFDEPLTALPRLQDRIAEQVVAALRVELSDPERARLRVRSTDNVAAYDLYLRGRSLLVNYTEANMREAIGYFEQALSLDPGYATARTGIATAAAWFSVRYAHEQEALDWAKRADQEARLALQQDGSLAEAHLAIASAAGTVYGGFDWKIVLDRSATALALDPSLDLARLARMRAFYHLGFLDDSRREGQLAKALNPSANVEFDRLDIVTDLMEGRYSSVAAKAEALYARTDAPAVRQYLGLAKFYIGDANGARAMLASITRHGRPDARAHASLASIEAASGMFEDARRHIDDVLRGSDMDHHVAYSLGAAFAQLGDANASLMWLERAADTGFPCIPWFERDSLLDPVRRAPGFVSLMDRMRVANEELRRRTP